MKNDAGGACDIGFVYKLQATESIPQKVINIKEGFTKGSFNFYKIPVQIYIANQFLFAWFVQTKYYYNATISGFVVDIFMPLVHKYTCVLFKLKKKIGPGSSTNSIDKDVEYLPLTEF